MAQRDINTFKATANARYTDNSSGQITAAHSRDTFGDVADSFLNRVDDVLDEDDMASDSDTKVPTQQSVKAYVDNAVSGISVDAGNGTYTPTVTGTTNVSSTLGHKCQWLRIGNVVTVSGRVRVTPTSGGGAGTAFTVSLPVATTFTSGVSCGGTALSVTGYIPAGITARATTAVVDFFFEAPSASVTEFTFSLTYLIES